MGEQKAGWTWGEKDGGDRVGQGSGAKLKHVPKNLVIKMNKI